MIYCSKCVPLNPDTSINCSNCGAPLSPPEEADPILGMNSASTSRTNTVTAMEETELVFL